MKSTAWPHCKCTQLVLGRPVVAAVPSVAAERQQRRPGPLRRRLCQAQCSPWRRGSWSVCKQHVSQSPACSHSMPQRLGCACGVAAGANPCRHRAAPSLAPGNDRRATGGSPQGCAGHNVVITLQEVQQAGVHRAAGCLHGQWSLQYGVDSSVQCVASQNVPTAICSSASVILRDRSAPAVLGRARPEPSGGRQHCQLRRCLPGLVMQGTPGSTGSELQRVPACSRPDACWALVSAPLERQQ